MAKRPSTTSVGSGFASRETINNNFTEVTEHFDNFLSLDGETPNAMLADLDMNSNDILNVGTVTATLLVADDVTLRSTDAAGFLTQAENAADAAEAAAANVAVGSPYGFEGVSDLLADTSLSYTSGTNKVVVTSGQYILAGGHRYLVAASGASDENVETAGGVKLYVVSFRGKVTLGQFGAVGDGTTDDTANVQKGFTYVSDNGGTLTGDGPAVYKLVFDSTTTADPWKQAAIFAGVYSTSLSPVIYEFPGCDFDVHGTGTGRIGNGTNPWGGIGERGAAFRFHRPGQANKAMRPIIRHMDVSMDNFIAPIATFLFDDWEKGWISDISVTDFNADDNCYAFTYRNTYNYSERTRSERLNKSGTGGTMGWYAASETLFPVSYTDHNGDARTAGDPMVGTSSFARTIVKNINFQGGSSAYEIDIQGGTYDSTFYQLNGNGGNIAIVRWASGSGAGTTFEGINSEQGREEETPNITLSSGSNSIVAGSSVFEEKMAYGDGAKIVITGAGPSGADLVTHITSYSSPTVALIADTASTTVISSPSVISGCNAVQLSSAGNSPAFSHLSVGTFTDLVEDSLYTGASKTGSTNKTWGNLEVDAVSFRDGDSTAAWMFSTNTNSFLQPNRFLDNVTAANSTDVVVVPKEVVRVGGNSTFLITVKDSSNAVCGMATCFINGSNNATYVEGFIEKNCTFSTAAGDITVNQTSGGSLDLRISYFQLR